MRLQLISPFRLRRLIGFRRRAGRWPQAGGEVMRVLVDGLETMIEGEVIGGERLDGQSGRFDLESEFTVRCDNDACFTVHGWLVDVEVLNEPLEWVM